MDGWMDRWMETVLVKLSSNSICFSITLLFSCPLFHYGWMDGLMDGLIDGWIDRWTDGWIDRLTTRSIDG